MSGYQNEIEAFRENLMERERSENTISSYTKSCAIYFSRYEELNKKNMLDFKQWQMKNWKPKTVNNRVIGLNQFAIFLGHPEYCVKGLKMQHASSVENVITLEEYKQMLEGLFADGNLKGYFTIKYLAKTGARVSEFIQMKKSALDKGYFELMTKGKIRRIYIPHQLIEESREYLLSLPSEYLFPSKRGRKITTRGVAENIKNWAVKYGIPLDHAYPHSFRHLYAIEFLKKNSNLSLLADLMGHSDVSTTSIYLRLSKEEQIRQFNEASNW